MEESSDGSQREADSKGGYTASVEDSVDRSDASAESIEQTEDEPVGRQKHDLIKATCDEKDHQEMEEDFSGEEGESGEENESEEEEDDSEEEALTEEEQEKYLQLLSMSKYVICYLGACSNLRESSVVFLRGVLGSVI